MGSEDSLLFIIAGALLTFVGFGFFLLRRRSEARASSTRRVVVRKYATMAENGPDG